jgi:MoaA/NifB/PqqE/SkfB family radical SAM enzyme
MTTREIFRSLDEGRKHGADYVDFIGGEATIRKDFFELLSYAKKIGYSKIVNTTNGRMYSYPEFSKKAVESGLNEAIISIHGPNKEMHDDLTQAKGSFDQAMKGIENLRKAGISDLHSNTTITKANYKSLPEMMQLFARLDMHFTGLIFPDPDRSGLAYTNFEEIVPTYKEAAPFIQKAIDVSRKEGRCEPRIQYVPFCFLEGYERYMGDVLYEPETEHHAIDFIDQDVIESRKRNARIKGPQCKSCRYFMLCEGIWKEYAKKRGFKELVPILGSNINSKKELIENLEKHK